MKKGFTLVEVLATVVILVIIFSITGILILNTIEKSGEKAWETTKLNLEEAAVDYVKMERLICDKHQDDLIYCEISLKELVEKELINDKIINNTSDDEIELDKTYIRVYNLKEGLRGLFDEEQNFSNNFVQERFNLSN